MRTKQGRRRFLQGSGAALAGLAVSGVPSADAQVVSSLDSGTQSGGSQDYGERSRFEISAREKDPEGGGTYGDHRPDQRMTPLQDLVGIITPSPLHYVMAHGHHPPDIDPRQHRLMIHGMVDRPLVFTMDELKRLPPVSRIHFMECQANRSTPTRTTVQQTHGKVSCSEWTGVPLSFLLKEAGVQRAGSWIIAEGDEAAKMTKSVPMARAMDERDPVLLAYGQNGEAVRPEQGYPLRLIVPGFEAINNVKWVRRIKVTDEPYLHKLEYGRYMDPTQDRRREREFSYQEKPKSVITRPSGGQHLPAPGYYQISGLAWSGGGAVQRVEVSTDSGRTWEDAHLQQPVLRMAWTRFNLPWKWDGGEAVLQSRCTDELGRIQPTMAEFSKLGSGGVNNAIQPWRVDRDGSVHNAIGS